MCFHYHDVPSFLQNIDVEKKRKKTKKKKKNEKKRKKNEKKRKKNEKKRKKNEKKRKKTKKKRKKTKKKKKTIFKKKRKYKQVKWIRREEEGEGVVVLLLNKQASIFDEDCFGLRLAGLSRTTETYSIAIRIGFKLSYS